MNFHEKGMKMTKKYIQLSLLLSTIASSAMAGDEASHAAAAAGGDGSTTPTITSSSSTTTTEVTTAPATPPAAGGAGAGGAYDGWGDPSIGIGGCKIYTPCPPEDPLAHLLPARYADLRLASDNKKLPLITTLLPTSSIFLKTPLVELFVSHNPLKDWLHNELEVGAIEYQVALVDHIIDQGQNDEANDAEQANIG